MLRIDYVMIPERFGALTYDIPKVEYSDHYPVVTTVEL
jgi:exonuclease III